MILCNSVERICLLVHHTKFGRTPIRFFFMKLPTIKCKGSERKKSIVENNKLKYGLVWISRIEKVTFFIQIINDGQVTILSILGIFSINENSSWIFGCKMFLKCSQIKFWYGLLSTNIVKSKYLLIHSRLRLEID